MIEKVDVSAKFALFDEPWRPKVVAELNGQEVKVVRLDGAFPWHKHDGVDEMFFGWKGRFRLEFRDRHVEIGPGEFVVVPRGVEHRPVADEPAEAILFEPTGVRNTGDAGASAYTAPDRVRL